jgi:hypothetical protein
VTAPLLTREDACEARILRYAARFSMRDLADLYGVSRTSMTRLLRGETYADARGPLEPPARRARQRGQSQAGPASPA